jgi:hypothetical protein
MSQPHMTVMNTEKPVASKEKLTKANLKYMRDKDREMVKGIFKYYEVPGACMEFVYKAYKEDPLEKYTLWDGEAYNLPLGVAKHLNKNGWYPVHAHAQDADGRVVAKVGQKVRRFGFQSLEFVDIEDLTPQGSPLVTVEKAPLGV